MTIAVDFDGTIVEHRYPQIGEEIPFATATLKMLINERHRLILWSVREGKLLEEAVEWQGTGCGILCRQPGLSGRRHRTHRFFTQSKSRSLYR